MELWYLDTVIGGEVDKMSLTKEEKQKSLNALTGGKPLSMKEVYDMEQKLPPNDRKLYHNLMYGKESASGMEIYEMLKSNSEGWNDLCGPEGEFVRGYRREDGTFVEGYCRDKHTDRRR